MPRALAPLIALLAGCVSRAPEPAPTVDEPEVDRSVGVECPDTGDDTPDGPPTDTAHVPQAPDEDLHPVAWVPDAEIVVYATRHAEKQSEGADPGLTEEGVARAEALALVMADVPLSAIYATELRRTQDTVAPTAAAHGLPIETGLDPEDELAVHIRCTHAGQTVLHAGHSYTVPGFLDALGVEHVPSVSGYGQLFKVHIATDGRVTVEETTYGD